MSSELHRWARTDRIIGHIIFIMLMVAMLAMVVLIYKSTENMPTTISPNNCNNIKIIEVQST